MKLTIELNDKDHQTGLAQRVLTTILGSNELSQEFVLTGLPGSTQAAEPSPPVGFVLPDLPPREVKARDIIAPAAKAALVMDSKEELRKVGKPRAPKPELIPPQDLPGHPEPRISFAQFMTLASQAVAKGELTSEAVNAAVQEVGLFSITQLNERLDLIDQVAEALKLGAGNE